MPVLKLSILALVGVWTTLFFLSDLASQDYWSHNRLLLSLHPLGARTFTLDILYYLGILF